MEVGYIEKELALRLATEVHIGQTDLSGHPYIEHIKRVGDKGSTMEEVIVGYLHDVLEDDAAHPETVEHLKMLFDIQIVEAIKCLTRPSDMDYMDYIKQIKLNPLATKVKINDLEDNLSPKRMLKETPGSVRRREKYEKALEYLKN